MGEGPLHRWVGGVWVKIAVCLPRCACCPLHYTHTHTRAMGLVPTCLLCLLYALCLLRSCTWRGLMTTWRPSRRRSWKT